MTILNSLTEFNVSFYTVLLCVWSALSTKNGSSKDQAEGSTGKQEEKTDVTFYHFSKYFL